MKKVPIFNFSITNAGASTLDIHIDGAIVDAESQEMYKNWFGDETSVSFRSFRKEVEKSDAKTYNVFINSPGGQVIDAMAIHDLLIDLQSKGKTVNTYGRGLIASAATYILMAGNKAEMSANSWLMIHNCAGGVRGDVNEIEKYATLLRKFNNQARDFYVNATGLKSAEIEKMMNAETWLTAEEAKDKGFIKEVSNEAEFTNHIDREVYNFTDRTVLNLYNSAVKKETPENGSSILNDMKKLFEKFSQTLNSTIKGIKVENKAGEEATGNEALLTAIGGAIENAFNEMGAEMETEVNTLVENSLSGEAFQTALNTAVANAVTEAVKPLNQTIADLKKENENLAEDVAKNLGGESSIKNEKSGPAPIGVWSTNE